MNIKFLIRYEAKEFIYIKKYKNLSGTYNFEESNAYIALIGLNGSGKSNLLEAISIVVDGIVNKNGSGSVNSSVSGGLFLNLLSLIREWQTKLPFSDEEPFC